MDTPDPRESGTPAAARRDPNARGRGHVEPSGTPGALLAMLFGVLVLALAGCTGRPADPLREVRSARAIWAAQELRSYRFDFERQCFCVPEAVEPVTVEVREGAVHEVRSRRTGEVMPVSEAVPWYTIEQLFDQIEEARAAGIQPLRVQYHARGYPTEIEIGSLAADAGIVYRVGNLQSLQ